MKKVVVRVVVAVMAFCMVISASNAADDAPEIKIKADLEAFYEYSENVGGDGDDDKIKANQLYVNFAAEFDKGMAAVLKLDGADIIVKDGDNVTEHIVEEANFSVRSPEECPVPVTLIFGKDEMPFGMDYDKHLNDSVTHLFEVDKVWGVHGIFDLPDNSDGDPVGNFAAATYQHRHSLKDGESRASVDNQIGDNYCARLTIDKLVKNVSLKVSGATEDYSDISTTDAVTGTTTISPKDSETKYSAGVVIQILEMVNINLEHTTFNNMKGTADYDPSVTTIGLEYEGIDKVTLWGRWEIIGDDTSDSVEKDFWTLGVAYAPAENYTLSAEYSNFNSGNLSDAKDLMVADGSIENALLLGVKAAF